MQGQVLTKDDLDHMHEHYAVVLLLSSDSVRKPAGYVMRPVEQAMDRNRVLSDDQWRRIRASKLQIRADTLDVRGAGGSWHARARAKSI